MRIERAKTILWTSLTGRKVDNFDNFNIYYIIMLPSDSSDDFIEREGGEAVKREVKDLINLIFD